MCQKNRKWWGITRISFQHQNFMRFQSRWRFLDIFGTWKNYMSRYLKWYIFETLWIYIYRYGSRIWNRVYFYQICLFFSVFKSPKFSWTKSHAFPRQQLCRPPMMASVPTIPGTWTRCRIGSFGASLTSDLARPWRRQVPRCGVSEVTR